jgi:hypothetical protein
MNSLKLCLNIPNRPVCESAIFVPAVGVTSCAAVCDGSKMGRPNGRVSDHYHEHP